MVFQTDQTLQPQVFAFSHRDLVSEDSDVWLYIDLFEGLELSEFNEDYQYQGQAAKEPRLMLRTLFYGLTHGVVSGRKLHEICRNDNRFIILSGDLRPDRRTFDRFIRRHELRLQQIFVSIVRLAQEMGLVSLGRVALDGSKFKGAADKAMAYEKMDRAMAHIDENLKKLKEDLAQANAEDVTLEDTLTKELKDQTIRRERIQQAKAQIDKEFSTRKKKDQWKAKPKAKKVLVDPEALSLSNKRSFMFGYNVQAAVDEKSQIIVACDLHDNANDSGALSKVVDQVKENCGSHASEYLADGGYQSLENIKKVNEVGSTPIICRKNSKAEDPHDEEFSEQVKMGSHAREYFCKAGRQLPLTARCTSGYLTFLLPTDFCEGCNFQSTCHAYGKKHPQVLDDGDRAIMNTYLNWSRTPEFKEAYKRRKAIVEPVFGNIKNKGMKIWVRGRKSVLTWWHIAATAHNIEKIVGHLRRQQLALA